MPTNWATMLLSSLSILLIILFFIIWMAFVDLRKILDPAVWYMTKILLALQLYSVREKCKVLTINQTSTYKKKKKKIKLSTYDVAKIDSSWQPQEYIQLRRERERERERFAIASYSLRLGRINSRLDLRIALSRWLWFATCFLLIPCLVKDHSKSLSWCRIVDIPFTKFW